jgi:large subunit ribosomal protein L9
MKVILLEKINNLGNLGDEILVKPGFARNFLFPKYKAVLANQKNRSFFQEKIKEIERKNDLNIKETQDKKNIINGMKLAIYVKSSEKGKLFGSITSKNIVQLFEKHNVKIEKNDIKIDSVINTIGDHNITIHLKNNIKIEKTLSVIREE